MQAGKLSTDVLEEIVLRRMQQGKGKKSEIIIGAKMGEDCAVLDMREELLLLSTDPITATTKQMGKIAVNVNANDIAASGGETVAFLLTILLPIGSEEEVLREIVDDFCDEAERLGIDIVGGHTEVTDAVTRPVVCVTAIGKTKNRSIKSSSGAKLGQSVYMTKHAGIEGTLIILNELHKELETQFGEKFLSDMPELELSVIEDSRIAGEYATSMHDITEGGVLGACYELAEASGFGMQIDCDKIPLLEQTKKICAYLEIDAYRLISSGSLLFTSDADGVVDALAKHGIKASQIGEVTQKGDSNLTKPTSDEIYKLTDIADKLRKNRNSVCEL